MIYSARLPQTASTSGALIKMNAAIAFVGMLILAVVAGCSEMTTSADAATRPGPRAALQTCTTVNNTTTLNVYILATPFSPNEKPYTSPTPVLTGGQPAQPSAAIQTAINSAFSIAPPSFQAKLCGLTAIFVNPTDCTGGVNSCAISDSNTLGDSWGFREHPSQGVTTTGRYIALSAGLWPSGGSTLSLSGYEAMLMQQLLHWPAGDPYPPKYGSAGVADNSTMTILAALAHEVGHVLWYDTFRPVAGGPHDFNSFCRGTFFDDSWQLVGAPPDWRGFGERQNEPKPFDNAARNIGVGDLALSLLRADWNGAHDNLNNIFRKEARWASLFAAFSPDEDFVETFEFLVLANATANSLASFPLTIYNTDGSVRYTDDIAYDYKTNNAKYDLAKKVNCFPQ